MQEMYNLLTSQEVNFGLQLINKLTRHEKINVLATATSNDNSSSGIQRK